MIKEHELFSFFTFFANCQTNKLEISGNGLLILNELFQKFWSWYFNKCKSINNKKELNF